MEIKTMKQIFIFILCIGVLFTGCSKENLEETIKKTETTDLSNEHIDGIKLGMIITDSNFIAEHGHFTPHPDNEYYSTNRDFDQYWDGHLIMSVNRSTEEILSIALLEDNHDTSTARGMTLGKTIDDVTAAYGDNYYTYTDREQGIYSIGYIDHENNFTISFLQHDGKVVSISFRYAFDRLNWLN